VLKKIPAKNSTNNIKNIAGNKKIISATTEIFANILANSKNELFKKKLQKMLNEVEQYAEKLKKNLTFLQLNDYKSSVKKFLQEIVKHTYTLGEGKYWDKKGKQKVLNLIRKVDNSLEELTRLFVKVESNRLRILSKLEEIKGMLVDLYK